MESLALQYRPRTFDDLVGQKAIQVLLRQMVVKDAVPTALLFDGPHGTGKTTTARILAAALNCEQLPGPCGHCPSCKSIHDGTSLNVIEIDAASHGLVDDIRALRSHVMYDVGGLYRVVILDEAHSMSNAAFNALLKTFEEPPPYTVFILLTTEPGRILNTVVSRCMPFSFRRIGVADIVGRLQHICSQQQLTVEPQLLTLIAQRADGALRDAVMSLDQVTRAGVHDVAAFTDLMGETDPGPALLQAIVSGNHATAFTATGELLRRTGDASALVGALATTLRDILILRSGGDLHHQGDALTARQALSAALDTGSVVAAIRVLWDLTTKVRVGDEHTGTVDLAVALLTDTFAKLQQQAPQPSSAPVQRKLSLQEMAAIRDQSRADRPT